MSCGVLKFKGKKKYSMLIHWFYPFHALLRRMLDELCKEKKEDPPKDVSTIKSLTKEVRNCLCNKRKAMREDL
ncbi:hypothetical protein AAZX31_18G082800 [Glycine max]